MLFGSRRRGGWIAGALVVALLVAPSLAGKDAARAQPLPPPSPQPLTPASPQPGNTLTVPLRQPPPPEYGLGVVQVAVGAAGMVLGAVPVGIAAQRSDGLGVAVLLAVPALSGLIVCGVGSTSSYSEGSCGMAVLGAYGGALVGMVAGSYFGCFAEGKVSNDLACGDGAVIGIVAGFALGAPVGATVAWHVSKRERPRLAAALPPSPPPPPREWMELPRRSLASSSRLTVPLLSFTF